MSLLIVQQLLLSLALLHLPCGASDVSPWIFVYDLPEDLKSLSRVLAGSDKEQALCDRVRNGRHFTSDASKADYFWIPGQGPRFIEWVKNNFPYWNQTVEAKQARHIMVALYDGGPREIFANERTNPDRRVSFPLDYDPASSERNVIFLTWNGRRDVYPKPDHLNYQCGVCFQAGLDIQIPTMENVCGPLCSGISIHELRNRSVWNRARSDEDLAKSRRHRMFFVGTSFLYRHDGTGRGTFFMNHYNDTRYVIASKGFPHHHPKLYPHRITAAAVMPNSEFSFSPVGVNGGDTDRYVPAVLYGSIPVLLNSTVQGHQPKTGIPLALPLEEIIDWSTFATLVDEHSMDGTLDTHLDCLTPRLLEMRKAMRRVWEHLLWTSIYSGKFKSRDSTYPTAHNTRESYLGETGENDAFAILMKVLAARIPHRYKPSHETMLRLEHKGWPCREGVDKGAESDIEWRI